MTAVAETRRPRALWGSARRHLEPTYEALLGEGVREGRFTTRGLSALPRQVSIVALLAVVALLASLLLQDAWRAGDLLPVGTQQEPRFLPAALFPVVILALGLGWAVILLGAVVSSPAVQLVTAFLFLVVNGTIGKPLVVTVADSTGLDLGRPLVHAGYLAVPGLLVVLALTSRWPAVRRRVQPLVVVGLILACVAVFAGLLWVQEAAEEVRRPGDLPRQLSGAVQQLTNLVLPLVFVSQLALVDLSYSLSTAAVGTATTARLRTARILFVLLVVGKLGWQLGSDLSRWTSTIGDRPWALVRTVTMLVAFLLVVRFTAALYRSAAESTPTEGVLYGASLLFGLPLFVVDLLLYSGAVLMLQFGADAGQWILDHVPTAAISDHGDLVVAAITLVLALAVAWWRRRSLATVRVATGVVVIASWVLVAHTLDAVATDPGILFAFSDVLVTAAVAGYAAVTWRRLDTRRLCRLAALVVFAWLVSTRGDLFTIVGGWFGMPDILLVVLGVSFLLLTDSAFTRTGSARVPRSGRSLLWLGYLILNLALLNWVEITHSFDLSDVSARRAVYYIGLPLAAWLVAVRRFSLGGDGSAATLPPAGPAPRTATEGVRP